MTNTEAEPTTHDGRVVDALKLRFEGRDESGAPISELRAAHVAEVLQGLTGLTGDFARAGAFGDGPAGSEVLVRPAKEGSFIIEVVRWVAENPDLTGMAVSAGGVPTLSQIIFYATKSARADVSSADYLENGNVMITWQDNTVREVPKAVWVELNKRNRRRKKHLKQLMAPLSDQRVTSLEVTQPADEELPVEGTPDDAPSYELTRDDYDAVREEDEIEETSETFEVEAQMSAVDFDNAEKWRVKTLEGTRSATVEDDAFLARVSGGMAIGKSDIFRLLVRQDSVVKNGRLRRHWTVLEVVSHRRAAHDSDA